MNFQVYETPRIYVFTLLIVLFSWLQLQIKYVCWNDTFQARHLFGTFGSLASKARQEIMLALIGR